MDSNAHGEEPWLWRFIKQGGPPLIVVRCRTRDRHLDVFQNSEWLSEGLSESDMEWSASTWGSCVTSDDIDCFRIVSALQGTDCFIARCWRKGDQSKGSLNPAIIMFNNRQGCARATRLAIYLAKTSPLPTWAKGALVEIQLQPVSQAGPEEAKGTASAHAHDQEEQLRWDLLQAVESHCCQLGKLLQEVTEVSGPGSQHILARAEVLRNKLTEAMQRFKQGDEQLQRVGVTQVTRSPPATSPILPMTAPYPWSQQFCMPPPPPLLTPMIRTRPGDPIVETWV